MENEDIFNCVGGAALSLLETCCFPEICDQDLVPAMLQLLPPGEVWACAVQDYPAGPIPPQYVNEGRCPPDAPNTQKGQKASILFFRAILEEVNFVRDYTCLVLNETQPCGSVYTRDCWLSYLPPRLNCAEVP
jgi:hypothetical protein